MPVIWIIILIGLLIIPLWFFLAMPNRRRDLGALPDYVFAHRGFWNETCPENSLPAFQRAVEHGYGIELDVQETQDRQLVVFHDVTLSRMCGNGQRIQDFSLEELHAFHLLDSKETIPTFAQVLKTVNDQVPLIVEIKSCRNLRQLCEDTAALLDRYAGRFCIESFDPRAVLWFRMHRPNLIRGQLVYGLTHGKYRRNLSGILLSSLMMNVLGRPDFIAMDVDTDDSLPFRLIRCLPYTVAWTVHSQEQMNDKRSFYTLQIFEGFPAKRPEGEGRIHEG